MQIARLAAEHDLPDLSVRAVREALRAGPPIIPAAPATTSRVVMRARAAGMDEAPADQVSPRVVANLVALERLWRNADMSEADAMALAVEVQHETRRRRR